MPTKAFLSDNQIISNLYNSFCTFCLELLEGLPLDLSYFFTAWPHSVTCQHTLCLAKAYFLLAILQATFFNKLVLFYKLSFIM